MSRIISELGAMLLALSGLLLAGNLWFSLVEHLLEIFRHRFRPEPPKAWHTLPNEQEDKTDD